MHLLSPDHQTLRFSGPDAQAFLQSQLTNDVDARSRPRLAMAGILLGERAPAGNLRACPGRGDRLRGHHPPLAGGASISKRLTMYRLRSKLDISRPMTSWFACTSRNPASVAGTVATLALGNGRWMTVNQRRNQAAGGNASPR